MNQNHPLPCFVHLGDSIPRHLEENIARTRRLFPELEIMLITDVPKSRLGFADDLRVHVKEPLEISDGAIEAPSLGSDPRFWHGYWQKTFNRLYSLQAAFTDNPGRTLVHVESDVLLLPSFPFDYFVDPQQVFWGEVGNSHDVAALLIIPNREALLSLLQELSHLVELDPGLNDMTALHKIAIDKSIDHKYLAMIPDDEGSRDAGLFDGLPWGHYLYGTDPRAFYGRRIVGRTMSLSRFAPSDYELRVEGQNLLVNGLPLHTLHIHSKALFAFTDTPLDIQQRIEKASRGPQLLRTSFIASAFVFSMRTMLPIWIKSAISYSKWRQLLGRSRA